MPNTKIIQIITSPTGGGAEVLVRELGERISHYGYESEVVYFNTYSSGADTINLQKNETVLGIKCRSLKAIWELRKLFKERCTSNQKCIIHAHLTWPFFYVVLASIGMNLNLVFTEHSTTNGRRDIPLFKYIERFFYGRYKKIISISQGTKESLDKWIGDKLVDKSVLVQNGSRLYDFKKRDNISENQTIKFVSVGSLNDRKGFDTAIKALALLKDKNWQYTIIGEGPEREKLEQLIKKLKVEKNVKLIGWSDKIEDYLHNVDIQLISSLWEGFGLVAVEGMSTGLPIVASNVDGLREVLDTENPAVFLVDKNQDEDNFKQKIEECIEKCKQDTSTMAKASRIQAEKFSMDKMIDGYIEVYQDINE